MKVLIWHLNGYWMLYMRREVERFHWPDWLADDASIELDIEQFDYLLDGDDTISTACDRIACRHLRVKSETFAC